MKVSHKDEFLATFLLLILHCAGAKLMECAGYQRLIRIDSENSRGTGPCFFF